METPQEIAKRAVSPRGKGSFASRSLSRRPWPSSPSPRCSASPATTPICTRRCSRARRWGTITRWAKSSPDAPVAGTARSTSFATAGSVDNIGRLVDNAKRCATMFAFVQAGTPVPSGAQLEVLGRLPEPEVAPAVRQAGARIPDLCRAARRIDRHWPEGSGTAYLMRQLFDDADLGNLGVRLLRVPR